METSAEELGQNGPVPACAAHASTWIGFELNVASQASVSYSDWDPLMPSNSASFWLPTPSYDSNGRASELNWYFVKTTADTWAYHVLLAGTPPETELGSGRLVFAADGSLQSWIEDVPVRLPAVAPARGKMLAIDFGHSTDSGGSGLDGVTSFAGYSYVDAEQISGNAPTLGFACDPASLRRPRDFPQPDQPAYEEPIPSLTYDNCSAQRTTEQHFSGNLRASAALPAGRFNSQRPLATSNLMLPFAATAEHGTLAELELYFRRESRARWDYHVLLVAQQPGLEVGSGVLEFDPLGRLVNQRTSVPLRLPWSHASSAAITLDFGPQLAHGGNGLDGVTAFEVASSLNRATQDGWLGAIGYPCPGSTQLPSAAPAAPAPACAAVRTDELNLSGLLSEAVSVPLPAWDSAHPHETSHLYHGLTLVDARGAARAVGLFYRHEATHRWNVHLLEEQSTGWLELGVDELSFAVTQGFTPLVEVEGSSTIRLPLADGLLGTPIALDFGIPVGATGREAFSLVLIEQGDPVLYAGANGRVAEPGCTELPAPTRSSST